MAVERTFPKALLRKRVHSHTALPPRKTAGHREGPAALAWLRVPELKHEFCTTDADTGRDTQRTQASVSHSAKCHQDLVAALCRPTA